MEAGLTGTSLAVVDWGRVDYPAAVARQLALVERRLSGAIPDTLAFTEHPPVYTIGRRRDASRHLVANPAFLAREGISVHQSTRGGDITYHGPGQIVGYWIHSLEPALDLRAALRSVEEALLRALRELGLSPSLFPGRTGLWVADRKIAAIGMAARQWVTYHGFALNHSPDLPHFQGIVPCCPPAAGITSLEQECSPLPPLNRCKDLIAQAFREQFGEQ